MMMYFTVKDSDGVFLGKFGDRYAAEEYAMTLKPQWQIICVNPSLILQGLIEALHWYVAEDYDDMLVKPSLKNTLDTLRETWGLGEVVMTAEPNPLYSPEVTLHADAFEITERINRPNGGGNLFLVRGLFCIGGADQLPDGSWSVSVQTKNAETDLLSIGEFESKAEAWLALWDSRHLSNYPRAKGRNDEK